MTSVKELQRKSASLPPVDTEVVLPAAIRAAANKAGQLHKDAYETPAPQQEQNGQERQPEETKAVETPPTPKAGTEEVPVTPPAKGEEFDGSWENRYLAMKGRYDKQEDVIRQLTSELGSMRSEIDRLRTSTAPAPVATRENTFKKLTAEEREAYGEDFIDVSARAAEEKLMPEIETLKATVADLTGKLTQVAKTSHDTQTLTMNQQLDRDLPDWRKINRDPRFIAWLNLRDPFSGVIRINMLKEAHAAGEAHRVLNFFNGFLRDEAVVDPVGRKAEVTSEGKVPLESLAAPGRAKAPAASPPPGEKETITRSQIKEFYALVNKGHYRGNEAAKEDLERRIFEAERDGRVIG